MLISFISEVQKRGGTPTKGILFVRLFITFCIAQLVSLSGLLSSQWLALCLNFFLSTILNIAGVNNTWHKRMLTIDAKALYIEHDYILMIALIVFVLNLLWLQGRMKTKGCWIAGGIVILFLTHLLCYSLMLFVTVPNATFYCTELVVIFVLLHYYGKQHLVKQPF